MKKIILTWMLVMSSLVEAQDLKILSWNVFMLPKPINFTMQWPRSYVIGPMLNQSNYDIVFLQEAFAAGPRSVIASSMEENFPYQDGLGRWRRTMKPVSSGLFLASRYPFEVLGWEFFQNCGGADCYSSKGVLLIEVKLPSGKSIQAAMTHLQASSDEWAQEVRRHQLQQVKNLMSSHAKAGIPQILVGDLNIDGKQNDEYPRSLSELNMSSAPPVGDLDYTAGFRVDCYKTPGGEHEGKWLDHVWLKNNESQALVKERKIIPFIGMIGEKECPLSDHHGVEAILQI